MYSYPRLLDAIGLRHSPWHARRANDRDQVGTERLEQQGTCMVCGYRDPVESPIPIRLGEASGGLSQTPGQPSPMRHWLYIAEEILKFV